MIIKKADKMCPEIHLKTMVKSGNLGQRVNSDIVCKQ